MFPGLFTLCLNTSNLADMRRFYETLGFKIHIDRPGNVLLNNGDVDIALMTFLEQPCLNFRGADPFGIHQSMTGHGLHLAGEPHHYKREDAAAAADADGSSWLTEDLDGNAVFFDTNEAEKGENGHAFALQRVLDATAKQIANVGGSRECQEAFRTRIQDTFMPPGRRATMPSGLDTTPRTSAAEFAGSFTLCLKTADNTASRSFYSALGLEVTGNNDETWVQMGNGDCQLALMSFLEANWLNFRGADPYAINARLLAVGFDLGGTPARYTEEEFGLPGAHWQTSDPDGNVVYFDTSDPERIVPGAPDALKQVLERAHRQLLNIEADQDCLDVFTAEILSRYA